jgi:hypothetical protein
MAIVPEPCETEGTLFSVEVLIVCESLPKATLPSPLKLNEVVWSSSFLGNKRIRLQVLPENDCGISKLKVVVTVELIVPLSPVPWGVSGLAESIRTIRWGNWNSPERSVGQLVVVAEVEVAVVEVELAWMLLEGRTLVERDVAGALDMWVLLAKPVALLKGPDAVDVNICSRLTK